MTKIIKTALIATLFIAIFTPAAAFAQQVDPTLTGDAQSNVVAQLEAQNVGAKIGKGLAVLGGGLAVFGAALGIGQIGRGGSEATARQPEAGGRIFTLSLITAAFIEGVTLFALVVALTA